MRKPQLERVHPVLARQAVEQAARALTYRIRLWEADVEERMATDDVTPFTMPVMQRGRELDDTLAAPST